MHSSWCAALEVSAFDSLQLSMLICLLAWVDQAWETMGPSILKDVGAMYAIGP